MFALAVFPQSGAALCSRPEYILDNSVVYLHHRVQNVWLHCMHARQVELMSVSISFILSSDDSLSSNK